MKSSKKCSTGAANSACMAIETSSGKRLKFTTADTRPKLCPGIQNISARGGDARGLCMANAVHHGCAAGIERYAARRSSMATDMRGALAPSHAAAAATALATTAG